MMNQLDENQIRIIWYPKEGHDEFWIKYSVGDKVIVNAPLHYIVSHFAKQPKTMFKEPRLEIYEKSAEELT